VKGKPEDMEVKTLNFEVKKRRLDFHPSYEVIGDICILNDRRDVAGYILETHPNIKVVLRPISKVEGIYRTKKYEMIAGERRTHTVYREYGFVFHLDLSKVYFSQRLSLERARVASLVMQDEKVFDMFAGIGCFTAHLARKAKKVIACDSNPDAIRYLRKNMELNKLKNVEIIEGDARDVLREIGKVDRVVMDLPLSAWDFLDSAMSVVKDGGMIHYYDVARESEISMLERRIEERFPVEIAGSRKVRNYAPYKYNVVMDILKSKSRSE
jgi:tRNA (guanine37-N1)-methyltransferase